MTTVGSAVFVTSSQRLSECPGDMLPEFAFTGRSNVGKSSLINMLVNRSGLAKTSSTPGKTRFINHFLVDGSWYIVDLPGYGYAKMPVPARDKMTKLTKNYLCNRSNLVCLFLLIDSRLEMQRNDGEFLRYLGENRIPFAMVFTKTDKVPPARLDKNVTRYRQNMLRWWKSMPPLFLTSSLKRTGREELLEFIGETLQ